MKAVRFDEYGGVDVLDVREVEDRDAMARASGWFTCRVGFVETVRAITQAAGNAAASHFRDEWPALGVIEHDQRLADEASRRTVERDRRTLDALQLAAALVLPAKG